ncbi:MAG TPA: RICIN domain-containing protein [Sphingobacteriaceae bacterium]
MKKLTSVGIKPMPTTNQKRKGDTSASFIKTLKLLLLSTLIITGCQKQEVNQQQNLTSEKGKASVSGTPGFYTIATYNLRRIPGDGSEGVPQREWSFRRPLVKDMILKYDFDIFGVQEPMGVQIDNLVTDLPGYERKGWSDHNDHAYQHQDIFVKKSKFTIKNSGKFWMYPGGPTSHTHTSASDWKPWDSEYHACVCTWVKLQDKTTGREFFVFNAHYDPTGTQAKEQSAILTLNKIKEIAKGLPSILMGDLNSNQYQNSAAPYHYLNNSLLLDETWNLTTNRTPTSRQTGNWWNINPPGDSQIDHIFVSKEAHNDWQVISRKVLWDHYDGVNGYNDVLPSDHFPVVAEMQMIKPTTPVANGTYRIMAKHSGKAVIVSGASTANDAQVVQWDYTSANPKNDEWVLTKIDTSGYYRITNVNSNLDLNVKGQSTSNLGPMVQWPYASDLIYNDEWSIISLGSGYYRIVSRHSGLSLNVPASSLSNGTQLIQYTYEGTANSQFQLIAVP